MITLDLSTFYTGTAKLADLPLYTQKALDLAGEGNHVFLTGRAPIWLYLKVAHALHGKAKKLSYRAPNTIDPQTGQDEVLIFDHDAF